LKVKIVILALSLAVFTTNLFAQGPSSEISKVPSAKPKITRKFLEQTQTDPARLLPPPAEDGSELQQREMSEVMRLIHTRSKERYAQAVWDARHEDVTPFTAVLGSNFDLAKFPATAKLLEDVLNDQTAVTNDAKSFFKAGFR